jgi:hypothetical protein
MVTTSAGPLLPTPRKRTWAALTSAGVVYQEETAYVIVVSDVGGGWLALKLAMVVQSAPLSLDTCSSIGSSENPVMKNRTSRETCSMVARVVSWMLV